MTTINAANTQADTSSETDWLDGQEEGRAPDSSKLGFEYGYFQSHRRYVRISAVQGDIAVYGLATFHARGLEFKDGYLRLIIPAGRKPEVLQKHLLQIAPGLDFFYMQAPIREIEYEEDPFAELED